MRKKPQNCRVKTNRDSVGRQRETGCRAVAQVKGRTTFSFLRESFVTAAKRMGEELLEFAVPEAADVVSGRKSF